MTTIAYLVVGLLVGLHVASWGAFKDSPFEGFRPRSYLRSVAVAVAIATALSQVPLLPVQTPVIVIGLIYALERLSTEWWKSIVREDDQSAYTIPMRLAVRGRTLDRRVPRYLVGLGVVVALASLAALATGLQDVFSGLPAWAPVLTVGGTGGWLTAVGGAWKDAPIEGFSGWKFLRSPAVATAWAVPLSLLTTNWAVLAIAAGGFAVASIETYKTFLTGGRPPGKFADRPVRFHLDSARHALAGVHVGLWTALAITLAFALPFPIDGLSTAWLSRMDTNLPVIVDTLVTAATATLALLVAATRVPAVVAGRMPQVR